MPLALILPLVTPIATELFKWLFEKAITQIPHTALPLISAGIGAAATVIGPHVGVDFGVSPAEGAALGLGGTGVHQVQKLALQK